MGGGAKSPLWNRIKADITGMPVVTLECEETASLGIVILSAVAMGEYDSVESAVRSMVKPTKIYEPDAAAAGAYEEIFHRYVSVERKFFGVAD